MESKLQCPVDFVTMNENKARLTAFFVLVLAAVFLITGLWIIIAFLMEDFILRSYNLGKYSLLAILSDAVVRQLKIKNKPADRAPKRFAANVGMVFTAGILILTLLHVGLISLITTMILILFAFLESFVGFCVGCYVYSGLKVFRKVFNDRQLK